MTKVKLISQEGELIEVDEEVAMKSTLIKNMIEDAGTEEDIPLPNVKTSVLKKVLEYCQHYKSDNPPDIEKPLKSTNMMDVVPEFDAKYIDIENLEENF